MKISLSGLFSGLAIGALFSKGQTNTKKKKAKITLGTSSGSSTQNNPILAPTYIGANQLTVSNAQKDQNVSNTFAEGIIKKPEPALTDALPKENVQNVLFLHQPQSIEGEQKVVQKTSAHVTQSVPPNLIETADTTAPPVDLTFAAQKKTVVQPAKQQNTYTNLSLGKQIWQTLKKVGLEVGLLKERKPWNQFIKEYKDVLHYYFLREDFNSIKQVLKAGEENVRYWYPDAALTLWQEMVAQVFAQQFQQVVGAIDRLDGASLLTRDAILKSFPERKKLWEQEVQHFILSCHAHIDMSNTKDYVEFYKETLLPAEKLSFVPGNAVKRLRLDINNFVNSRLGKINKKTLPIEIEGLLNTLFNLALTKERSNIIEYMLHKVYFLAMNVYLKTKDKELYENILEKIKMVSAYHVFKPITVASSEELDKYDQLTNLGDLFNEFLDKTKMDELFFNLTNEIKFNDLLIVNKDQFLKTRFMDAIKKNSSSDQDELKLRFAIDKLFFVYKDYTRTANKESFDFNKYRVLEQTPFDVISKINSFFAGSASFFANRKDVYGALAKFLAKVEFYAKNINKDNAAEVKKHFMSNETKFTLNEMRNFFMAYGAEEDLDNLDFIRGGSLNTKLEFEDYELVSWLSYAPYKINCLLKTVMASKSVRIERFYLQNILPFRQPLIELGSPVTQVMKKEIDFCWNDMLKSELNNGSYSMKDEEFLSALNRIRSCGVQPEKDMISQITMTA